MKYRGVRYQIEYLNDKQYMKGVIFIIASLVLIFPLLLFFLDYKGVFHLSGNSSVIICSFYAGAVTIGIALAFGLPAIIRYAGGKKIKGKIIGMESRSYLSVNRIFTQNPVVEFEYEGNTVQKTFLFLASKNKEIGSEVELLVPKDNPEKTMEKSLPVLACVITMVTFIQGFLFLPLLFFWYIPIAVRAKNAVNVKGKIIGFTNGRAMYSPKIEYKIDETKYESKLNSWSSLRPSLGMEIPIRVNPKDKSEIMSKREMLFSLLVLIVFSIGGIIFAVVGFFSKADGSVMTENFSSKPIGFVIWIGLASLLFLIGLIVIIVSVAKNAEQKKLLKLKESGMRLYCTIKEVKVNDFVIANGANPMTLVCQGGGRIFTLKARLPLGAEKPRCGNRVTVYVDEYNEKKYFVDLSSLEESDE